MSEARSSHTARERGRAKNAAPRALGTSVIVAGHLVGLAALLPALAAALGRSVGTIAGQGRLVAPLILAAGALAIVLAAVIAHQLYRNPRRRAYPIVLPLALVVLPARSLAARASGQLLAAEELRADAAPRLLSEVLGGFALSAMCAAAAASAAACLIVARAAPAGGGRVLRQAGLPLGAGLTSLAILAAFTLRQQPTGLLPVAVAVVAVVVTAFAVALLDPDFEVRRNALAAADVLIGTLLFLSALASASLAAGAVAAARQLGTEDAASVDLVNTAWLAGSQSIALGWFSCLPVIGTAIVGLIQRLELVGRSAMLRALDLCVSLLLLAVGVAALRSQLDRIGAGAETLAMSFAEPSRGAARPAAEPPAEPLPAGEAALGGATSRPQAPEQPTPAPPIEGAAGAASSDAVTRRVQIGEHTVDGPLMPEDAKAGVLRSLHRIEQCLLTRSDAPESGRVELRFLIERGGSVSHVELADGMLPNPVMQCLFLAIYRTGFASPAGERADVRIEMRFSK